MFFPVRLLAPEKLSKLLHKSGINLVNNWGLFLLTRITDSFYRCTSLYGTPTMFVDILNLPELKSYDITSLSTGYMAGAPCPQSIVKAVVHDLHMKDFVVGYLLQCGSNRFEPPV